MEPDRDAPVHHSAANCRILHWNGTVHLGQTPRTRYSFLDWKYRISYLLLYFCGERSPCRFPFLPENLPSGCWSLQILRSNGSDRGSSDCGYTKAAPDLPQWSYQILPDGIVQWSPPQQDTARVYKIMSWTWWLPAPDSISSYFQESSTLHKNRSAHYKRALLVCLMDLALHIFLPTQMEHTRRNIHLPLPPHTLDNHPHFQALL